MGMLVFVTWRELMKESAVPVVVILTCTKALIQPLPSSQPPSIYKNNEIKCKLCHHFHSRVSILTFKTVISMCNSPNVIMKWFSPSTLDQVHWICLVKANNRWSAARTGIWRFKCVTTAWTTVILCLIISIECAFSTKSGKSAMMNASMICRSRYLLHFV